MVTDGLFWLFQLGAVPVYWLLPRGWRMWFLTITSVAYLMTIQPISVAALIVWMLAFWALAPLAAKPESEDPRGLPRGRGKGWIVYALNIAALTYLVIFKYIPPLVKALSGGSTVLKVALPLGISYFTFKLIHYALEVGRGNIRDRSLGRFASYVFLAPIFTAGPVERYDHYLSNRSESFQFQDLHDGLWRIIVGLIKRFLFAYVIATEAAHYGTTVEFVARLDAEPTWRVWSFCILNFMVLYFEFSGYSDVAIGASRLFGLKIAENFDWPLFAPNISEFWKKWHMSLVNWAQAYVYMPLLGRTRNPYFAVYATFLSIGIWHNGTWAWAMWAGWHGTGVVAHQSWVRYAMRNKLKIRSQLWWRILSNIVTFFFVVVSMAFMMLDQDGTWFELLRFLAKLFFITIPA